MSTSPAQALAPRPPGANWRVSCFASGRRRSPLLLLLGILLTGVPAVAGAAGGPSRDGPPTSSGVGSAVPDLSLKGTGAIGADPARNPGKRLRWEPGWHKADGWDYVLTGTCLLGAAVNYFAVEPAKTPLWRGGILFDDAARRGLKIDSGSTRNAVSSAADVLAYALVAYPFLVDAGGVAWWQDDNGEIAWQLAMMDMEAYAVTEAVNALTTTLVRRHRPKGNVCDPNSSYDPYCTKSFISGHASNAFTGAGLICAQHRVLPLYGGAGADTAACAASLVAATAVGVSRVATNDHYATDVLAGAAVGLFSGYLMPNLLHLHFGKRAQPRAEYRPRAEPGLVMPILGREAYGLSYVARW